MLADRLKSFCRSSVEILTKPFFWQKFASMVYKFDTFELDVERFELRKGGSPHPVEPQVFLLLELLISNCGRMISKDKIHEHIWQGRIVSEAALSSRIRSARQAIGDSGKNQRFIKTVHGSGFRFDGAVEISDPGSTGNKQTDPQEAAMVSSSMKKPTVAVLPFRNLSGDSEQEYFSDAITSDIISTLSKHRWLDVTARNSTFGFKGTKLGANQIAKELGVSYLIEGSVQRSGDRIRVTAELIDAETGMQKWTDRYDRKFKDVFAVQDEITTMVVARLEPEIGTAERLKVVKTDRRDLGAWENYHLGIWHFFRFTGEDNLEAQRLLQLSREQDQHFGEAHAWWAYAVVLGMVYWNTKPTKSNLDKALKATHRALQLDSQNAVFHALKARVQLARQEYGNALAENEFAIGLNPTFAAAYCGLGDSLAYEGRYDEALAEFEKAIHLSPNDPQRWAFFTYGALTLIFKGDFKRAVDWTDRASMIPNCQYWTTAHRAVALAHLGQIAEAKEAVEQLLTEQPDFTVAFAKEKLFYLKHPGQLKCYLDGLKKAEVPER